MAIGIVFHSIALITIMIMIGAFITKQIEFNNDIRNMFTTLIVNIAMPCIILSSIFKLDMTNELLSNAFLVLFLSIIINILGIIIGGLIASRVYPQLDRTREIAILSGLGNTGFIGIPLCAILLGPEGALYAAMFDAGVDITLWTVGSLILQKEKKVNLNTLKSLINIPMIAIVFGLTFSIIQIKPYVFFLDLFNLLASLGAPLAMFYIGMLLMNLYKARAVNSLATYKKALWLPITIKLILVPLIVLSIGNLLSLDNTIFQTVFVQSMMPSLTLASILFSKFSSDDEMGAATTAISTIFAMFTIPLMILILNMISF
ncbi:AEC family transporter [Ureibacillus manganicus]|uniref:Permease n=1 Tax=Ureibacillus manganicus DSM 26584 TaxID=1384049 RepID=A0A0A3I264_9BACL|nr:AEC family transporter [Ureibacillus manganicus]KGR77605.1 permease [Ureibacillus manganicus DSM 26584]